MLRCLEALAVVSPGFRTLLLSFTTAFLRPVKVRSWCHLLLVMLFMLEQPSTMYQCKEGSSRNFDSATLINHLADCVTAFANPLFHFLGSTASCHALLF
jgi:hypothetical protein